MSFPQFDRLPPEIRSLVWTSTLALDGPALYLFSWRWYVQFVDQDGEMDEFEGVDRRVYIEVPLPEALFVCREARQAAQAWMAANNLTMRFRDETQGHILVREWDRERDPLYVSRDKWEEFVSLEENWADGVEAMGESIHQLAVPAFTAYYSIDTIASLLDLMPNLHTLYIVWAGLPALRRSEAGRPPAGPEGVLYEAVVQPRWETEPEDGDVTSMCVVDQDDGRVSWEEIDLADYIDEIQQQWLLSEVPDGFLSDKGEVNLKMVHVRAKQVGVGNRQAAVVEEEL
ncbi:hypothetical protein B0J13DRAFT_89252 [Dactylonectria estremocensis]|uniref:2EXR domain-containing protein n=1 Tax=Dactylonectria estremocensis TaxID=1079267 RepID=A0A9P9EBT2_9HYPO|nr:hypothetical protein B0J13DRAFT_89252 [Dactylonectria estremocensis]